MDLRTTSHRLMIKGVLALAATLTAFALGVSAAEMDYHGTFCSRGQSTVIQAGPELTILASESWGIQTPDSTFEPWKNATNHCVAYVRVEHGKAYVKGSCQWTDAGGDTFTGEFEVVPGQPGRWTFLGGTGKWKGVQGGGTYHRVGTGKPFADGSRMTCNAHSGKLTLP